LTRSQRAGKGAEQSAAGGGDYVVQCGRVWVFLAGLDPVVLRDLTVYAEQYRLVFGGDASLPYLAFYRV
jgi:hypothetical protein